MKKKWKYLRDQFAAELKKFPSARSGDAAGDKQTSKWVYFQLLFFLKDVIEPRTSTGNLSSVIASNAAESEDVSLPGSPRQEHEMSDMDPPFSTEENTTASLPTMQDKSACKDALSNKQSLHSVPYVQKKKGSNKRMKQDDYNQSFLEIEKQKMQYLLEKSGRKQDKDDDEDLMFFKSLLPHVKKISPTQKLAFRGQIQVIVQQYAYPTPTTPSPSFSYGSYGSASVPPAEQSSQSYINCATSPMESVNVPFDDHNITMI